MMMRAGAVCARHQKSRLNARRAASERVTPHKPPPAGLHPAFARLWVASATTQGMQSLSLMLGRRRARADVSLGWGSAPAFGLEGARPAPAPQAGNHGPGYRCGQHRAMLRPMQAELRCRWLSNGSQFARGRDARRGELSCCTVPPLPLTGRIFSPKPFMGFSELMLHIEQIQKPQSALLKRARLSLFFPKALLSLLIAFTSSLRGHTPP